MQLGRDASVAFSHMAVFVKGCHGFQGTSCTSARFSTAERDRANSRDQHTPLGCRAPRVFHFGTRGCSSLNPVAASRVKFVDPPRPAPFLNTASGSQGGIPACFLKESCRISLQSVHMHHKLVHHLQADVCTVCTTRGSRIPTETLVCDGCG
ncbi:hypothetical protein BCV70DRAFT_8325 [Testicularia cyperi]|uniref:Uncharacterized protein n=1 Tax=Testicularia cyperi TaxID=1882483 RepID=A0A317Y047_9BASI|nr:hypothetical protein BCV70DRAFT_8325 [Testicularia cyperi]